MKLSGGAIRYAKDDLYSEVTLNAVIRSSISIDVGC